MLQGAALLIVLVTLILVTSAAAALLRLASTEHARRNVHGRVEMALDVACSLDAPIRQWLQSESAGVVLPPDAEAPYAAVLHDEWLSGRDVISVRVSAFDQCGMAPHAIARSGSPLRGALPADVTRLLDAVTLPRDEPAGLDQFALARERPEETVIFPVVRGGHATSFGPSAAEQFEGASSNRVSDEAFGALIATHDSGGSGGINVMTAPLSLVEAAMRLAGRGDVDRVIAAREAGEQVELAAPPRRDRDDAPRPRIVTSSSAWAFRIDVRVGSAARSWWAVYERSEGQGWRCVQRLAIAE
jgi:hypothetical protein